MNRPDLGAVLDHYGVEYMVGKVRQVIRCPNPEHEDFVKSCSIDLDEGVVNCFGCSLAGSSLDLIMRLEGVDFGTAVRRASEFPGASDESLPSESRYGKRVLPVKRPPVGKRNSLQARRRRRSDERP